MNEKAFITKFTVCLCGSPCDLVCLPSTAQANTHSMVRTVYTNVCECVYFLQYESQCLCIVKLHRFGCSLCYAMFMFQNASNTIHSNVPMYSEYCEPVSLRTIFSHIFVYSFKRSSHVCRYIFVWPLIVCWSCAERRTAAAVAVAFGWLLCLWYAKCDIFSHLLALRLYECVGVVSHIQHTFFSLTLWSQRNFCFDKQNITQPLPTHSIVQRHLD